MKISTEQLDNRQVVLTIEVEPERVERFLRQGARRLANRIRIPGFRKGKAPYQIIVNMVGKNAIYQEVLDDLIQEAYREALSQTQIEPIAQAELDDIQIEPLVIRMRVPLAPEVKPGDYRSIRVEQEEIEVTDEEVEEVLNDLRESRSRWVEVDRPAQYGDLLTVDIKGTADEETVIDQTDWEFVPAEDAEAEIVPGFDAAFIGMEPGETREFTLTYPADSNSRWAGKDVHFVATLKKIQARETIELNDEFAASIGDFQTLDELRESIRSELRSEREREAQAKHVEQVLDALVENAELVKYPPILLEQEIDRLIQDQESRLQASGLSMDEYLKLTQTTPEQYHESIRPQAEQRLVRNLLLDAVADAEEITVTPEEVEAEIVRMLQSMAGDTREQMGALLRTPAGRQIVAQDLRTQKTIERLLAIARGEVEEATSEGEAVEPGETEEEAEASAEASAPSEDEESVEVKEAARSEAEVKGTAEAAGSEAEEESQQESEHPPEEAPEAQEPSEAEQAEES
ncbi:MAG: trigger factor [Anaerolineae bacterium]|nr:trigger factor [Anaerolineae bacterium]